MMDFKEASEKITTIGVESMMVEGDATCIHFVLKNGETISLYTTEIGVDYCTGDKNTCDEGHEQVFVQSEMRFMKGDLS